VNAKFAGLVRNAENWQYSSYSDYVRSIKRWDFVEKEFILSRFGSVEDYREFVKSFATEKFLEMEGGIWEGLE
jgi:hypothetical protein